MTIEQFERAKELTTKMSEMKEVKKLLAEGCQISLSTSSTSLTLTDSRFSEKLSATVQEILSSLDMEFRFL